MHITNSYNKMLSQTKDVEEAYTLFKSVKTEEKSSPIPANFFHGVLCKISADRNPQINPTAAARDVYDEMMRREIKPITKNFITLFNIAVTQNDKAAFGFFRKEANRNKIEPNTKIYNHMINMYTKLGRCDLARDRLLAFGDSRIGLEPDEYTERYFNNLIVASVKDEKYNYLADYLYGLSKSRTLELNKQAYFHLVKMYIAKGNEEMIFKLYQEMKARGIAPDHETREKCWKLARTKWMEPVDKEVKKACKIFYDNRRPISNFSELVYSNSVAFKAVQDSRMEGSGTLRRDITARVAWNEIDKKISELAIKQRIKPAPINMTFISHINKSLDGTGEYRDNARVTSGGRATYEYAPPSKVEHEMELYLDWLKKSLKLCDQGKGNPIETAARAFQRLVTIHPFCDQNGRTSRMVMDYILQRYELMPAAMGSDVLLGLFSFNDNKQNPTKATQAVLDGIKRSYSYFEG